MRAWLTIVGLIGALTVPGPARSDSAAVFMYHRFGEAQYPSTNVRMDDFQVQLALLQEEGFQVIPLARLLAWLRGQGTLPENAVVLTVDDAYASIYDEAWPELRRAGLPFTVFVATDAVDAGLPGYLNWSQLEEMARAGVTFANHGAAHTHLIASLPGERPDTHRGRVRADLLKGQARLLEQLGPGGGVLEDVFAYPFGEYDTLVAGVIDELGWLAFGQQSGPVGALSEPLALPRFPVSEAYSDLAEFRTKARSLPLAVERVEPWDPVVSSPIPGLELWLAPSAAQLNQLSCFISGQGQVEPEWLAFGEHFRISPPNALPGGRSRVNCTAPGEDGRYYWFSHQWMVR